jgi:SRSO17 transposase
VSALDAVVELIGRRFTRSEPRRRAGTYMRGLLAGLERKNGWTLAEHAGELSPDGIQRLLRTADWDVEGVRDDLRGYVLENLGDAASGVFVVDETGFIKKGVRSAGVQRQYTGTTGKIDNCQLGVFLGYASTKGRALIDRELYLPTSWTEDPDRCAAAGIPIGVGFATKPQLGICMLARSYTAGLLTSTSWVTADEVYGQNPTFRGWLSDREVPFVLATRNDDMLASPDGHRRQAKVLATLAGARDPGTARSGWERRSIGAGAHGERVYDWTAIALDTAGLPDGWGHWLLVRRQAEPSPGKTVRELAFYRCAAPAATPIRELIRVAGARWAIEECFQTAKNEAGLDHYQVRSWRAWYAHITLAMLATAYLAATRATEHERDQKGDLEPASAG